jgi:hypothetical protein
MRPARESPLRPPVALWQLLAPLHQTERRYVIDVVFQDVPNVQRDAEIRQLWSDLPPEPRAANGRPGSTRLADHDGLTVHHTYLDTVRVSLFEFGAPAFPGCRVTMETSTVQRGSAQWSLAFKGVGGGSKAEIKTSLRAAFSASRGERKRVFLDVPARITRVFELKNGALRPTDLVAAEPERKRASPTPFPGIESIPAKQPEIAGHLAPFRTAGDRTGDVHIFEFGYEKTRDVSASVQRSLHGVNVGVSASVGVTCSVKLTMELAAGHDYDLYATANGHGIGWRIT